MNKHFFLRFGVVRQFGVLSGHCLQRAKDTLLLLVVHIKVASLKEDVFPDVITILIVFSFMASCCGGCGVNGLSLHSLRCLQIMCWTPLSLEVCL